MKKDRLQILTFIIIAYTFSWIVELVAIFAMNFRLDFSKLSPYLLVAQFGPTIAALVTAYFFDKKDGVNVLLKRVFIFRFHWISYILALFTIPFIFFILYIILGIVPKEGMDKFIVFLTLIASILNGLLSSVFGGAGPLGEELGWRGFLNPLLRKKNSILITSVIIGIVWAFWHLPIFFFSEWRNGLTISQFFLLYPISTILIAYFMSIVAELTRGSVFIAIWLHGIVNSVLGYASNYQVWNLTGKSSLHMYLLILFGLLLSCIIIHLLSTKKIAAANSV